MRQLIQKESRPSMLRFTHQFAGALDSLFSIDAIVFGTLFAKRQR